MRCPEGLLFVCKTCRNPDADFNHIVSCQKLSTRSIQFFQGKFRECEEEIKQRNEKTLQNFKKRRELKLEYHRLCVEETRLLRQIKRKQEEQRRAANEPSKTKGGTSPSH